MVYGRNDLLTYGIYVYLLYMTYIYIYVYIFIYVMCICICICVYIYIYNVYTYIYISLVIPYLYILCVCMYVYINICRNTCTCIRRHRPTAKKNALGKKSYWQQEQKVCLALAGPFLRIFGNNIIINNNENRNKNKNNGDNKSGQFCWPILFYGMWTSD